MTTIFLFAHQDDELGVFHEIAEARNRGHDFHCIYLTNGAWGGANPEQRNAESRIVLGKLGVSEEQIFFLGTEFDIEDSRLVEQLDPAWNALLDRIEELGSVDRVIMHAWEGGHPDHDATYLLGLALARRLEIADRSWQFPMYRMPAGKFRWTFAQPLSVNGNVSASTIPVMRRLHNLWLLRHYRSQWRAMMRVAPHLAWDYMRNGTQKLQPVCVSRITERPYPHKLLYEKWQLYCWNRFKTNSRPFIKRHFSEALMRQLAFLGPFYPHLMI